MSSPKVWNNRVGALALGLGLAMSAVMLPCWWSIFRYHNPSCSAYKPDFVSLYTGAVLMPGTARVRLHRRGTTPEGRPP